MLIIAVIFAAVLITPFVFFRDGKRNKLKNKLLDSISKMAEREGCKISKFDFLNDAVIAISNDANKLFYICGRQSNIESLVVGLDNIISADIFIASRTVDVNGNGHKVIEKVAIVLEGKSAKSTNVRLSFYDDQTDGFSLSGELQLAEKWNAIINESIAVASKNGKSA